MTQKKDTLLNDAQLNSTDGRQAANSLFEAVQARASSRLTRLFSRAIEHARKPATKPAMWAKLFIRGTKPNMASTAVTRVRSGKVTVTRSTAKLAEARPPATPLTMYTAGTARVGTSSTRSSLMARAKSGSLGEVLPPVPPLLGVAKSSSGGMGFKCPSVACIQREIIAPQVRDSLRLACWGKDWISEELEGDGAEKCSRGTGFSSTYIQIIAIRTLRSYTCKLRLKLSSLSTSAEAIAVSTVYCTGEGADEESGEVTNGERISVSAARQPSQRCAQEQTT
ncbi:MAG: hypothetical protein FRX49_00936 [Trebouxia sp. A1-2]|nr:MAG: hypothetical protein FRX49_00936 [Trebouxia sp. A1-2]